MDSIHPHKDHIGAFCEGKLDAADVVKLQEHLAICELCREYCDMYMKYNEDLREAELTPLAAAEVETRNRLFRNSLKGLAIPLAFLRFDPQLRTDRLAADGTESFMPIPPTSQTFFSEFPEVILRVTPTEGKVGLQLIAAVPELAENILISERKNGIEVVTDVLGKATVAGILNPDFGPPEWQLTTPIKSIPLESLLNNSTSVESSQVVVLNSESGDQLNLTLVRKSSGLELLISPIGLSSHQNLKDLRVAIRTEARSLVHRISEATPLKLPLDDVTKSCVFSFYI